MMTSRLVWTVVFIVSSLITTQAGAAGSRCLAVANAIQAVPVHLVTFRSVAADADQIRITYVGHSTFRLESPGGLIIATDYAGYAGDGPLPNVVTMNHAHETHYTDYPDPGIGHVLRGWNPEGGPAEHNVVLRDVYIRNVTTDVRRWAGTVEKDGNSIFIFEMANLCIGHLGHLHHELTPQHLGWIGQLDIVFVPVDGSYTMRQSSMLEVLKLLKARMVIPMHYFGQRSLRSFIARMGEAFDVDVAEESTMVVSQGTMPDRPTVVVLPGPFGGPDFGDP